MKNIGKLLVFITRTQNGKFIEEERKNRTIYKTKKGFILFYKGSYIPVIEKNDQYFATYDEKETSKPDTDETPVGGGYVGDGSEIL